MATEKTPLLATSQNNEVIIKIAACKDIDFDGNNNEIKTSLDYEELVPYIIDPHWIRLRKLSFLACWIVFFIIFFAACISAAISGSCGNLQNISSMPSASKIDNAVPMTHETTAILSVVIDKAIAGD